MKLFNFYLLVFFILRYDSGVCQNKRIDSLLTSRYEAHSLHGNVLVGEGDKITYQKSFGHADIARQIPNQQNTRFQLASIGKTFTAVAVLQLQERNKLKLDDPVVHFLPAFPFKEITIRQLLSHTSGLPDLQIFAPFAKEDPNIIIKNGMVIDALKRYGKLEFTPGSRWAYSNPGYCVLALVVEKITRKPFMNYLADNIWKKAGMVNTYPFSAAMKKPDSLRALSYRMPIYSYQYQQVDTMQRYKAVLVNYGGLEGLGFIASTARDLFNFDQALSKGLLLNAVTLAQAYEPAKLLSGEPVVVEPGKLTYGLGWFIATDSSKGKIVSHSGYIPGGATMFMRNLSTGQCVIALDNGESSELHRTAENVMNIICNKQLLPQRQSMARVYANDLLVSGADFAAAHLQEIRTDTSRFGFSPGEMDFAAHELNAAGYKTQGLETSKLLTFLEPVWQTFHSYGELLAANGKPAEAVMMFKKSLGLNPGNHVAKQMLSKLDDR